MTEGVKTIDIDTCLQIIPQLIARIDHPRRLLDKLIHDLLTDVGKQHPQVWRTSSHVGEGGMHDRVRERWRDA